MNVHLGEKTFKYFFIFQVSHNVFMHQLLNLVLPADDLQKLNKVSCAVAIHRSDAVAIHQSDVKKIKIEKYQGTLSEIKKKY